MVTVLPQEAFAVSDENYSLLPFRFDRWANGDYLVVNEVGEFCLLSQQDFKQFSSHRLASDNSAYTQLRARHFLTDRNSSVLFDVLAAKYRTRKSFLDGFVKLHIFVLTQRCNQSCQYCQVTRQSEHERSFDMTEEILRRAVDLVMANPSQKVTMEFQGGESLLNFDLVKEVDEYLRFNLGSMFIRDLNPYGYALKTGSVLGYTTEEFLDFYRESLSYILHINREGRTFSESFAGLILSKMLSPWPVGFVTCNRRRAQDLESSYITMTVMCTHPMNPECWQKWRFGNSEWATCWRIAMTTFSLVRPCRL